VSCSWLLIQRIKIKINEEKSCKYLVYTVHYLNVVFTICQQLSWNKIHNLKYHSKRTATLAELKCIPFIQIRNSFDILNFAFLHSVDLQVTKHLQSLNISNNWTCCQYSRTTPYGHLSIAYSSLSPDKMAIYSLYRSLI